MLKKSFFGMMVLLWLVVLLVGAGFTQEDKIVQTAINAVRAQMRIPSEIEIKFVEKKESPLAEFYSVKLMASAPDRDVPIVVYVDKEGDRVIIGNLIIKGDNVTQKEAGQLRSRKIDLSQIETNTSPFRGAADAKVTVVEFSNFQCPHCLRSWETLKELLAKHAQDVKYVFKHFPLPTQGKTFDVSEMVAAVQESNGDAFWTIHDFLFAQDGQEALRGEREAIRQRIAAKLKEMGHDDKAFLEALESGKGRKRVQEDLALGNRIRLRATPTLIINGELVRTPVTETVLERYLRK